MLDIQGGQPTPLVTPAAHTPAPISASVSKVPGVGRPSNQLTIITALASLLLVAGAGGYVSFVRADRVAVIATRNREITQLKQQLTTPERVKTGTLADQLKAGVASLQSALAIPSPWTPHMVALADRTPSGVLITAVTVDPKLNLRVTGTADGYGDVAKFMAGLTNSSSFAQVTLDSSAKSETSAGSAVAFSLKATFVPSPVVSAVPITTGSFQ